jgi:hypothetical protein
VICSKGVEGSRLPECGIPGMRHADIARYLIRPVDHLSKIGQSDLNPSYIDVCQIDSSLHIVLMLSTGRFSQTLDVGT